MKKFLIPLLLLAAPAHAADVRELTWDVFYPGATSGSYSGNHAINATNDQFQAIFQCVESCAIDSVGFRYGARTGTPCTHTASLQGVSASTGQADGTIKSSTNAKVDFTPPASTAWDSTFQWVTLGSTYTCTEGEWLAIDISDKSDACTPDGSNQGTFSYSHSGQNGTFFPYAVSIDGGVATKRNTYVPFGYKCGSRVYGNPVKDNTNSGFGSDHATNDEFGTQFRLAAGSCDTAKISGVKLQGTFNSSGRSFKAILYSGTTSLTETTVDSDTIGSAGGFGVIKFPTSYSVTCGSDYIVAIQPQDTTNWITLGVLDYAANADLDALSGGTTAYTVYRVNAGAWSSTNTRRVSISPIISDITEPSGGSAQRTKFNQGLN